MVAKGKMFGSARKNLSQLLKRNQKNRQIESDIKLHIHGGKDFEMYCPLVRRGGMVVFHDIVKHPPKTGCEVDRLWNEIKHSYPHIEIVRDWSQGWAGIGIVSL